MTVNKGLSPKSMGLIYMYDNTSNFDLNSVASVEKSIQDVYGSQILNNADKRVIRRSQYYSIPLKYQGGLLVVAKSPEPVYQSNGPILYPTLKEFIEVEGRYSDVSSKKIKGYVGEVPEEVDWFFVESVDVFVEESDIAKETKSAEVNVNNYFAPAVIANRYGNTTHKNLNYTSTYNTGSTKGFTIGRNESAAPMQAATSEASFIWSDNDTHSAMYPVSTFRVQTGIGTSEQISFVFGLIDEKYKNTTGRRDHQLLVMYPDVDDIYKPDLSPVVVDQDDFYYQGNKPFTIEVFGERRAKHFLSTKLETLSHIAGSRVNVNELNVNTLTHSNLSISSQALHGMALFHRGTPTNGTNPEMLNQFQMSYSPLSIRRVALPQMNTRSPINLGVEFEETQMNTTLALQGKSIIDSLPGIIGDLRTNNAPTFWIPLNLGDMFFELMNTATTIHELKQSYSNELFVADSSWYAIVSEVGERWVYTIPQTEIVDVNGKFIRNRKKPFYNIPVNTLFKSVPEFYEYMSSIGVNNFQNVNLKPYINSEYDVVWDLWAKMRHRKSGENYYNSTGSLPAFIRPNDTRIDYNKGG